MRATPGLRAAASSSLRCCGRHTAGSTSSPLGGDQIDRRHLIALGGAQPPIRHRRQPQIGVEPDLVRGMAGQHRPAARLPDIADQETGPLRLAPPPRRRAVRGTRSAPGVPRRDCATVASPASSDRRPAAPSRRRCSPSRSSRSTGPVRERGSSPARTPALPRPAADRPAPRRGARPPARRCPGPAPPARRPPQARQRHQRRQPAPSTLRPRPDLARSQKN